MLLFEPVVASPIDDAPTLAERYEHTSAATRLRAAIRHLYPGRIALVSSFGADSAVLLHLVAQADPATPVIFVDTGQIFPETLAFRDALVRRFGLTNVTTYKPDAQDLAEQDPEDFLWASDPDRCCNIRKVLPLGRALEGYDAWISGRKRFQSETRDGLPIFEASAGRTKVNALADWSAKDLLAYIKDNDLPRHRWSRRTTCPSVASPAPARCGRERMRAPGAGAVAPSSNAASTPPSKRSARASDGLFHERRFRRRSLGRPRDPDARRFIASARVP